MNTCTTLVQAFGAFAGTNKEYYVKLDEATKEARKRIRDETKQFIMDGVVKAPGSVVKKGYNATLELVMALVVRIVSMANAGMLLVLDRVTDTLPRMVWAGAESVDAALVAASIYIMHGRRSPAMKPEPASTGAAAAVATGVGSSAKLVAGTANAHGATSATSVAAAAASRVPASASTAGVVGTEDENHFSSDDDTADPLPSSPMSQKREPISTSGVHAVSMQREAKMSTPLYDEEMRLLASAAAR